MNQRTGIRKGWALLVTLLLCLQLLPLGAFQVSAEKGSSYTSNKVVAARLDKVFATYGPGTYFTYNGKACTDHQTNSKCCTTARGCNCRRVLDDGTDLLAWQCFGFARYVFYTCFGFIDNASVSPGQYVSLGSIPAGQLTAANVKALLTQAKAGAHIRVSGHSLSVLSTDAKGITVIHANINDKCDVVLQTLTWERFASLYNWRGVEYVNMPKNYPGSDEQTLPSVTTKNVDEGVYTFKNVSTGRMLQVGGKDADETPVTTGAYKSGDKTQQFKLRYKDNGRYYLGAMNSSNGDNRVVDVIRGSGNQFGNGNKLEIYRATDANAQLFHLIPMDDGSWVLELAAAPEKVITGQSAAGKQLTIQAYTGAALQKWQLCTEKGEPAGGGKTGVYTVTVDEGSVLNIRSSASTSSAIKGTIPNKTAVPVKKISDSWGYILYNGIQGWISLDYATYARPLGDLNGDGDVRADDALIVLQGTTTKLKLSAIQKVAADVDWDSKVAAADALLILQMATEKITAL